MFLASLMLLAFAFATDNTQTIIESSAVIAASVAGLIAALRANNKRKSTRAAKPKPKTATPPRTRLEEAFESDSM